MAASFPRALFWLQVFLVVGGFFTSIDGKAFRSGRQLQSKAGEELRLPRDILPRSYDVSLLPILTQGNFTTEGSVSILMDCVKTTNKVVLHVADITVETATVTVRFSS